MAREYRITGHGDSFFTVESSEGRSYLVNTERETCECSDFIYRGGPCKHIRMAREFEKGGSAETISLFKT